jgi:exopolysaccharide biosynthesis polyprenyl glycosylphosphotransferase
MSQSIVAVCGHGRSLLERPLVLATFNVLAISTALLCGFAPVVREKAAVAADLWCVVGTVIIANVVWIALSRRLSQDNGSDARGWFGSSLLTWALVLGLTLLIHITAFHVLHFAVVVTAVVGGLLLAGVAYLGRNHRGPHAAERRRMLVVGHNLNAARLVERLQTSPEGSHEIVGSLRFGGDVVCAPCGLPDLGPLHMLRSAISRSEADTVVVAPSEKQTADELEDILRVCDEAGIRCIIVPHYMSLPHLRPELRYWSKTPVISFSAGAPMAAGSLVKRSFDLVFATSGLVLLLPVMVVCAVLIKLSDGGPVLFRQRRAGLFGQPFVMLKFRTMRPDAEKDRDELSQKSVIQGGAFKLPDDPRVTSVGRFLRKYSLDELPQLVNVLLGHMSIVGPRPLPLKDVDATVWWQRRRHSMRPGITCIWQTTGRKSLVPFDQWVAMDLSYIDNWSVWLDLKLVARTVPAVLAGTGV